MLDFKLAELLAKYNLPATFYIPQSNAERPVIREEQIKELSESFEIGGHTLHHVRLAQVNDHVLQAEVDGCYHWLSQLLGKAPQSFCFPGGAYDGPALQAVYHAGFAVARTTALFSTSLPAPNEVTDTTLQAYPHSALTYAKHLAKRKRWTTLARWMKSGSETGLCKLAENYLDEVVRTGGCFHLWGHSWEIEEYNLWKTVESLFRIIANRPGFSYVENGDLQKQQAFFA